MLDELLMGKDAFLSQIDRVVVRYPDKSSALTDGEN